MTHEYKPTLVQPELVLIVAVAENLVIGKDLNLPWHFSEDLKRFKRLTLGHPILMGRKTFDSLLHQFHGPLKDRTNVVISRNKRTYDFENVVCYTSVKKALNAFKDEPRIFIGGGSSLYNMMLKQCDRWEITLVHGAYEGNAFFPEYRHLIGKTHELASEEPHEAFTFQTYTKITHETT